jgi:hypothetical protein
MTSNLFRDMYNSNWNFAYYVIPVYFKGAARVARTTVFQRAMYLTKDPTLRLRPYVFVSRTAYSKERRLEFISLVADIARVHARWWDRRTTCTLLSSVEYSTTTRFQRKCSVTPEAAATALEAAAASPPRQR